MNENKTHKSRALCLFTLCTFGFILGAYALCTANCSAVSNVKAETPQAKVYQLAYAPNTTINLDEDNGTFIDKLYTNGTMYENVDYAKISNVVNRVEITHLVKGQQVVSVDTIENLYYVSYSGLNPTNHGGVWYTYDYMPVNFKWCDSPSFISYYEATKEAPITTNKYTSQEVYYLNVDICFISNGHFYNSIQFEYKRLGNVLGFYDKKDLAPTLVAEDNAVYVPYLAVNTTSNNLYYRLYCSAVYYYNEWEEFSTPVARVDSHYDATNNITYYGLNPHFLLNDYRNMNIIGYDYERSDSPILTDISTYQLLLKMNHNFQSMLIDGDTDINTIFATIAGTLSAILPLLNLQLSGQITLGILILTPICFGLFIAIYKLIKR